MARFAVVGATSWGLTLAWLLRSGGHRVSVVTRSVSEADAVNAAHGIARLPELRLADDVRAVPPGENATSDGIVLAVPSQALRTTI